MTTGNAAIGIIGGGVIGLSIAYQLAKTRLDARESIVVIDGQLPGSASWAGAGILPPPPAISSPDPLEALQQLSLEQMPCWSNELRQRTGIDNEYRRCGGVYVAVTPGEHAALHGLQQFWQSVGITSRILDRLDWQRRYPWWDSQLPWDQCRVALEVPAEAQVRNPWHLQALRAACEQMGVTLIRLDPIQAEKLTLDPEALTLSWGDNAAWKSESWVVAAGSWTSNLLQRWLPNLLQPPAVYPVKGEMLLFKAPHVSFAQILNVGTRYIVPRLDGHILVGSTEQEVGFDSEPSQTARSWLLQFVDRTLPRLRDFPLVKQWAGLRPASYDQLPVIGRLPQYPQVMIASGHFRSGLQWSIGTALCVAALLRGDTPPIDLKVFHPGR
jgi:glycine oxidase